MVRSLLFVFHIKSFPWTYPMADALPTGWSILCCPRLYYRQPRSAQNFVKLARRDHQMVSSTVQQMLPMLDQISNPHCFHCAPGSINHPTPPPPFPVETIGASTPA